MKKADFAVRSEKLKVRGKTKQNLKTDPVQREA
jgi:hypothetical protein